MMIKRATGLVQELIPDLNGRISQFEVETFEMDEELVSAFCDELARLTQQMQSGMESGDPEQIRIAAHSVKGMGGTMGLPEISVLAEEIELSQKAGEDDRCTRLCSALIDWAGEFAAEHA